MEYVITNTDKNYNKIFKVPSSPRGTSRVIYTLPAVPPLAIGMKSVSEPCPSSIKPSIVKTSRRSLAAHTPHNLLHVPQTVLDSTAT